MYRKPQIFLLMLLMSSFFYSSCTYQKNRKIDKLTIFVTGVQNDYKEYGSEEWESQDEYFNELIKDIKSYTLTEEEANYIKKQETVYKKVKVKWKIENSLKF